MFKREKRHPLVLKKDLIFLLMNIENSKKISLMLKANGLLN